MGFHVFFLIHVSKTRFFACFSGKICSPGGNPLGHGETKTTAKTQGFGNWLLKTIVKNQGSAAVECANLNFCSVFLSLTWNSMGVLLTDKQMLQKTRFRGGGWCRTLCFHVFFLVHVSKTPFFACFSGKICSSTGPRRDQIKPKRLQKHRVLETGCLKKS